MCLPSSAAQPAAAVRRVEGHLHVQDVRDGARVLGRVLAPLPARARLRAQDPAQVQVRPLRRLLRFQGGRRRPLL